MFIFPVKNLARKDLNQSAEISGNISPAILEMSSDHRKRI